VVDEAGDVAADRGVTAPRPADPEDPDAALGEIPILSRLTHVITDELAGIVDDPCVLGDWLAREHAEAMDFRAPPDDLREGQRRRIIS